MGNGENFSLVVLLMNVVWIVVCLERCKRNKIVNLFANISCSYIKKKLKYYLAKYGNRKKIQIQYVQ